VLLELLRQRELEAPLERLGVLPLEQIDMADVRERVDPGVGVADPLGQLDGAGTPLDRRGSVLPVHVEMREVAVRHRELVPPRLLELEHRNRLLSDRHRLLDVARVSEQAREGAKRVALAARVAGPPVALDGALLRGDGVVELADQVARVRPLVEELSLPTGVETVRESHCPPVLGGCLPLGAQRGRPRACCGRELENRRSVPDSVRMVCEPREVGLAGGRRREPS
jgi:hypothetical protein